MPSNKGNTQQKLNDANIPYEMLVIESGIDYLWQGKALPSMTDIRSVWMAVWFRAQKASFWILAHSLILLMQI